MKIKLVFRDRNSDVDIDYKIVDSPIAQKWYKKLRHIHRLPVSKADTRNEIDLNLSKAHRLFCEKTGIKFQESDYSNQEELNHLHWLYETHHNKIVNKTKDTDFLYLFHQAIHNREYILEGNINQNFNIGWGTLEGPLTDREYLNPYYSEQLKENNLYLPWAELGKKPLSYYRDKEPEDQRRFNELVVPHRHFRVQFKLHCGKDLNNEKFEDKFMQWFQQYKSSWLQLHGLNDWIERDEFSGVHLAEPVESFQDSGTLLNMKLKKIELHD